MAEEKPSNSVQDESDEDKESSELMPQEEKPKENLGYQNDGSTVDEEVSSEPSIQSSDKQDEFYEEKEDHSNVIQENSDHSLQDEFDKDVTESSKLKERPEESPGYKDDGSRVNEEASSEPSRSSDNQIQDDSSGVMTQESPDNLVEDDYGEDEQKSEKSSEQEKMEFEKEIKYIFSRPSHSEPRHPIFSSPFVRRIAVKAFGPKKPRWYTPLTSSQLYLFKDLINFIEIGRQGIFHFDAFMEAFQDFDPGITRAEVLDILGNMEKNEYEELDFGKFLFLLAYKDHPDIKDKDDTETALSTSVVTPRQCLILSAISYYVLIASPEEITRYYIANTRRKSTVLHFHMEAARLGGLTEKQMEEKQKKATQHLGLLFALTGSPYACPIPFVPRTKEKKIYREFSDRKLSRPKTALPMKKKPIQRPIQPIKQSRKLGDSVTYKTKDDKTFYDMHYGRIPMPVLKLSGKMRKEINKKFTVKHKDYITKKAYEAVAEYKERLKNATVLYNKRSLDFILKRGFPTIAEEEDFIEVFQRYMPLQLEDVKNFSFWVKPADYERNRDGKPLYPDNYAFGKKIA